MRLLGRRAALRDRKVLDALRAASSRRLDGLEIADKAGLVRGTVHPNLARLEASGLVDSDWDVSDPHPDGRPRRLLYWLTDAGRAWLDTHPEKGS